MVSMTWLDVRIMAVGAAGVLGACAPQRVSLGGDAGDNASDQSTGGSTGASSGSITGATASTSVTTTIPTTGGSDPATAGSAGESALELGWGLFSPFQPLVDGGDLVLVIGGQGLAMFPVPLRGTGFYLPQIPYPYDHPQAPLLDIELDVEGLEGIGGHFIYLANYPIPFGDWGDSYQFYYVALLLPDEVGGERLDPADVDGRSAHLLGRIHPFGEDPVVVEYDLTLRADIPG